MLDDKCVIFNKNAKNVIFDTYAIRPDVQIVVQPGSLAARNYYSWQKLFGKIHALLSQIDDNGKNSRTFQLSYLTHVSL